MKRRKISQFVLQLMIISSILLSNSSSEVVLSDLSQDNNSDNLHDDQKTCYLYNISGCYAVQAPESDLGPFKLYAHIPIAYGRQALIGLKLWEYPTGRVLDYKINQDYPGPNILLEIQFGYLNEMEIVYVYWSMLMIVEKNDYSHLPEVIDQTPIEELPTETTIWLESTEFAQASHPEIQAKAEELAGNETNAYAIAKNIGNFTGLGIDYQYTYEPQDALTTLQNGFGVCTGKSNLAVALLRALDIPARMLLTSPLPHFFIELYLHPYGWIRCEATPGTVPFDYHWLTVGYCVYPSDETSSSVINGIHPYEGQVTYWGTDNPSILWDYIGVHCKRETYTLVMNSDQLEQAYNLSNLVWENFVLNFNSNLTNQEQLRYESAINYQIVATNGYINQNITKFLNNMELSLETYLSDIVPLSTAESSIYSVLIFCSLILIGTVDCVKKRRVKQDL